MILVTGGTGMVGAHVLLACVKENSSVIALYREESKIQKVAQLFKIKAPNHRDYFDKIQWFQSDLNDLVNLEEIVEKTTHIYHCAAKVSFAQHHSQKLLKTNIEGTANLVNLAIKYKVKKFAFVSSIAALGVESTVNLVNEEHLWNSDELHTPYAYSKYGAELEVWRGSQEGLDVVIVNPGLILGSHFWKQSSGALIGRIAKGMAFYPTGNAAVVALDDVVSVLYKLMNSSIKNERFILVSKNMSYKNLIEKLAEQLGVNSPKIPLSKFLLYLLFLMDRIAHVFGLKKPFLNLATIKSLSSTQKYDGNKIEKRLDFTYQDLTQTFFQTTQDYKSNY
jgi:dihydroflavonol-4-reductase